MTAPSVQSDRTPDAASAAAWPSDWSSLTALAAEPIERLVELHDAIDASVNPVIVELCRLRIATLHDAPWHLGMRRAKAAAAGLTEEKIAALADWHRSPLFTDAERACLALAEQFCLGAYTVSEADVDAVLQHLSPGECFALVNGLWVIEAVQRMGIVMGVDPDPAAFGLTPATTHRSP